MLSAYPTKHSRVGNAVGLDTPVSTVRLLRRMRDAGYDLGAPGAIPGLDLADDTEAGDALIHALIAAGGQDEEWLTAAQLTDSHVRIGLDDYRRWTADLPAALMDDVTEAWGEAPGRLFVNDHDEIVLATITAGNVVLLIQPPRGFGENPVAIYHDPDLAPSHHYLAAYRWLGSAVEAGGFGAHAVVHLGKHGSMEWLPGKNAALSAACATDAAIGNLPLIYPFLVNDPGEGAQAKRRAHATIVDHLIPPMARAESYGDIAKLEQLLDEHANIAAMDPAKLPAIRAEIWTLMHAAEMHRDLGLDERPDDDEFDDFILHVDGWLCEIKDAQIRDGLHVLGSGARGRGPGQPGAVDPSGRPGLGRRDRAVPGLRAALGLKEGSPFDSSGTGVRGRRDRGPGPRRWSSGWRRPAGSRTPPTGLHDDPEVRRVLRFAADQVVPRLAPDHRRARRRTARAGRRLRPRRALRLPAARTRQRAPDRPQLLHGRPARRAVPAGLGDRCRDGRLPRPALPRRHRRLPGVRRPLGLGHVRDAHVRRRHRRGPRPARRSAHVGHGLAPRRRPGGRAARGARPSAHRRDGPDLRLLPRRVPARRSPCSTTRSAWSRSSTSRSTRTSSAPTRRPTSPSTATYAGRPPGSSAPSPGRTAPASCR